MKFENFEQKFVEDNKFLHGKYREMITEINPDVVISFMPHNFTNIIYSLKDTGIPVIASHHTAPNFHFYDVNNVEPFVIRLRMKALEMSALNTVLMDGFISFFSKDIQKKTVAIPNSVTIKDELKIADAGKKDGLKTILNISRISPEKNQQLIIRAFALLADRFEDWQLKIVGPDNLNHKSNLESLVKELNLTGRVLLEEGKENVYKEYENSQIHVQPSQLEGFGLTIIESLIHGLPNIVLEECYATSTHIREGKCGLLCKNDPKDFAAKLEILIKNHELRNELGQNGIDYAKKFNPDVVYPLYEKAIRQATNDYIKNSFNIVLTTNNFLNTIGGLEKVITQISEQLIFSGHKVTIINEQEYLTKNAKPAYKLNPNVEFYNIFPIIDNDSSIEFDEANIQKYLENYEKEYEIEQLRKELNKLKSERTRYLHDLNYYKSETERLYATTTWKIGKAITWIPWKLSELLMKKIKNLTC